MQTVGRLMVSGQRIVHQPVLVQPEPLLIVQRSVEKFKRAGPVGDCGRGSRQNQERVVELRLHIGVGAFPRDRVALSIQVVCEAGEPAALSLIHKMCRQAVDPVVCEATATGDSHQDTQRVHVGHARGDRELHWSGRVSVPLRGQVSKPGGCHRAFRLFQEGAHLCR